MVSRFTGGLETRPCKPTIHALSLSKGIRELESVKARGLGKIERVISGPTAGSTWGLLPSYLLKQVYLRIPKPSLSLHVGKDRILCEKIRGTHALLNA